MFGSSVYEFLSTQSRIFLKAIRGPSRGPIGTPVPFLERPGAAAGRCRFFARIFLSPDAGREIDRVRPAQTERETGPGEIGLLVLRSIS